MQAWFFTTPMQKPFVILIEASGDSAHPGRTIDDSFESAITFEIAQALKQALIKQDQNIKVLINRSAHEVVAPLQNANFANKLTVDLYLSIHAFYETEIKPRLFIYQFSYKDPIIQKKESLSFYPIDKVYLSNQKQTDICASHIKKSLEHYTLWQTQGIFSMPFKPLLGINAPAIGIELGLKNRSEWTNYIEAIASALSQITTMR